MTKIGIDPGLSGAIAFLGDNNLLHGLYDMPVMPKGKHQQVNAAALRSILGGYRPDGVSWTCFLEQVGAMPGQGVSSMFSFGMSFGIVLGVLAALQIPVVLVAPQTWKKRAGILGKDKDYSRTLAQQLYPQAPLGHKKDHGRADALLIARFSGVDK